MSDIQETIKKIVTENDIVLFLKGTQDFPQCGFSATVVQIMQMIDLPFTDINILEDDEIRQGIKDFSNWPTLPQLYVKGEFVGGCDIIREMYEEGELQELLQEKGLLAA